MVFLAHREGLRDPIVWVKVNGRAKLETQRKTSSCPCLPRGFWVLTAPGLKAYWEMLGFSKLGPMSEG